MRPIALVALALAAAGALAPLASGQSHEGAVEGRVLLERGQPAEGALLELLPGNLSARSGADGTFHLDAPPGSYLLRATLGQDRAEVQVTVADGETAIAFPRIYRRDYTTGELNPFPFVYLAVAMILVAFGGFYVNRMMAQTGIALDKSILGGAPVRKPWRRRKKKTQPPPQT